jgi:NitT/TauT family transport system substrate-binding protein
VKSQQLWIAVALTALAGFVTVACTSSAAPPAAAPAAVSASAPVATAPAERPRHDVRIGYPSPSPGVLPIYVAWREGIFAEDGLDPELSSLQTNLIISGLLAGEIDYGTSFSSVVHAAATGADVRAIFAIVARPQHSFVVRPEITSGEQLAGKRIAVTSLRGAGAFEAQQVLARFGLARGDATLLAIPGDASRLQAMVAGALDAAVLTMPFDLQGEQEGLRILVRLADIMELTHAGVGTTVAKLRGAPDEVKRFVKGSLRGIDLIKRDKAIAVRHLSEWLDMPPELASRAYDAAMATWSDTGMASEAGLQLDLAEIKAELGTDEDIPIARVVDYTPLREAARELGRPVPP